MTVSYPRLLNMETSSVYATRRARISWGVVPNPSTLHWWRHVYRQWLLRARLCFIAWNRSRCTH